MSVAIAQLDKKVLVIDKDSKHRRWLARIARSVALHVDVTDGFESSADFPDYDLVIMTRDGLDPHELDHHLGALSMCRAHPLLIASSSGGYLDVFNEFQTYGLMNLLAKNEQVNSVELIVTMQKILRDEIFGLDKYFSWGVPTMTESVATSADRKTVLAEAERYVADLKISGRMAGRFCGVVDELLTNALYDAPVDGKGEQMFAKLARSTPVEMPPGKEATISFCCDAYHLGVSMVDKFGALGPETCLANLVRCFRKSDDQIAETSGGSGLGIYLSFASMSQLVFNIARGRQTEVLGLMDIRGSYANFARQSKSFNIFVANE